MSVVLKNFALTAAEVALENIIHLPVTLVSLTNKPFSYYIEEIKGANGEVLEFFEKPKHFVPAFDNEHKDDTLILQYSNATESKAGTISVLLSINLPEGTVTVRGHGFHEITMIVEIPKHTDSEETHENSLPDSALPSKALDEAEDEGK